MKWLVLGVAHRIVRTTPTLRDGEAQRLTVLETGAATACLSTSPDWCQPSLVGFFGHAVARTWRLDLVLARGRLRAEVFSEGDGCALEIDSEQVREELWVEGFCKGGQQWWLSVPLRGSDCAFDQRDLHLLVKFAGAQTRAHPFRAQHFADLASAQKAPLQLLQLTEHEQWTKWVEWLSLLAEVVAWSSAQEPALRAPLASSLEVRENGAVRETPDADASLSLSAVRARRGLFVARQSSRDAVAPRRAKAELDLADPRLQVPDPLQVPPRTLKKRALTTCRMPTPGFCFPKSLCVYTGSQCVPKENVSDLGWDDWLDGVSSLVESTNFDTASRREIEYLEDQIEMMASLQHALDLALPDIYVPHLNTSRGGLAFRGDTSGWQKAVDTLYGGRLRKIMVSLGPRRLRLAFVAKAETSEAFKDKLETMTPPCRLSRVKYAAPLSGPVTLTTWLSVTDEIESPDCPESPVCLAKAAAVHSMLPPLLEACPILAAAIQVKGVDLDDDSLASPSLQLLERKRLDGSLPQEEFSQLWGSEQRVYGHKEEFADALAARKQLEQKHQSGALSQEEYDHLLFQRINFDASSTEVGRPQTGHYQEMLDRKLAAGLLTQEEHDHLVRMQAYYGAEGLDPPEVRDGPREEREAPQATPRQAGPAAGSGGGSGSGSGGGGDGGVGDDGPGDRDEDRDSAPPDNWWNQAVQSLNPFGSSGSQNGGGDGFSLLEHRAVGLKRVIKGCFVFGFLAAAVSAGVAGLSVPVLASWKAVLSASPAATGLVLAALGVVAVALRDGASKPGLVTMTELGLEDVGGCLEGRVLPVLTLPTLSLEAARLAELFGLDGAAVLEFATRA